MASLAALPYSWAFVAWDVVTLLGSLAAVYSIVRRPATIFVAPASPFLRRIARRGQLNWLKFYPLYPPAGGEG